MATRSRPLSPHLQVYRPMYTMALSMTHRVTGLGLTLGLLLLCAWLAALAAGPAAYGRLRSVVVSPLGFLAIGAYVVAFWYHLCAGLRHLRHDLGHGLERASARRSGLVVVVAALALSTLTLGALWHLGGRP